MRLTARPRDICTPTDTNRHCQRAAMASGGRRATHRVTRRRRPARPALRAGSTVGRMPVRQPDLEPVLHQSTIVAICKGRSSLAKGGLRVRKWSVHTTAACTVPSSSVFISNRKQAVRLPADVRLPPDVKRVDVRVRGHERIISPVGHT